MTYLTLPIVFQNLEIKTISNPSSHVVTAGAGAGGAAAGGVAVGAGGAGGGGAGAKGLCTNFGSRRN